MAKTIKISDELFDMLKFHSHVTKRSVPKQLEYWSEIGKIAEENPDLNFNFIKAVLLSKEELKAGLVSEYKFGVR